MQGINKAKHVRLLDALLQLEKVLDLGAVADKEAAKNYRAELKSMLRTYEELLAKLAVHIADYEELFQQAKVHFLAKKLKELKKPVIQASNDKLKQSTVSISMEDLNLAFVGT